MTKNLQFKALKGQTLLNIIHNENELIFITTNGTKYRLFHDQEDSESVSLVDICGDLADLIGTPILLAELIHYDNCQPPGAPISADYINDDGFDYMWSFYKLATINGSVTLRWFGESNGYYSIYVDFDLVIDCV